MVINWFSVILFFFFLLVAFTPSSSSCISDSVFQSHASSSRSLLQAKKDCPVNFEFMNYTVLTSKCKAPNYPPDRCCQAFKDFACPYVDILNDLTNGCADNMLTYIYLNGKYPTGLFGKECLEGKEGLACPATPPTQSANTNESQIIREPSLLLMLTSSFLVMLLTCLEEFMPKERYFQL